MPETFDLIVIGGGPGGYVAAIRAAQLKMKVALVERENLGGICLNWGCIPTKALLRASEINHLLHTLDAYGFAADNIRFDFAKVIKRSRAVAGQLSGGVKHLLKKNKVTVFDGQGALAGLGKVAVAKDGKPGVLLAPLPPRSCSDRLQNRGDRQIQRSNVKGLTDGGRRGIL